MSIAGSGGVLVGAPGCSPARYGLLSVAEVEDREETEGHWQAGFSHDVESCDELLAMSNDCTPTPDTKVGSLDGVGTEDGDSFTLVAGYKCSLGGRPIEDAWDFAQRRLDRGTDRGLERVFWTGQDSFGNNIRESLGQNPDVVDLTPVAGAVAITDGVALLESWAGENMPCGPIIHAARGIGTYLAERSLIEAEGTQLYARGTGSRIAIGGGYLVSGPNGVAAPAGEGWLFVTGGVKILRSPSFFTPPRTPAGAAVNRAINDVQVFAERTFGFLIDCGIAAIRVNLKSCCC